MSVASTKTLTVPAGSNTSNQADLGILDEGTELVGLVVVGAILSSTITFKVSDDGALFQTLTNQSGATVQVSVASNSDIGFSQDIRAQIGRWRFLQIITGSTESGGAVFRALVK